MCHPDGPSSAESPEGVVAEEVEIPLADGRRMPAYLATPPGSARGCIVVVGDIYGARTPFYEHIARLLAGHGFDAVVPEYFFRVGRLVESTPEAAFARKALLDEMQALLDLDGTVSWARTRSERTSSRAGTLGFCLGGLFVLDLAARRDDAATVCYYGFPAGAPGPAGPPERTAPRPLDEVDRIRGPVLGFWGDRDERVGIPNVERFARELAERGASFEHTVYPGLDHGFLKSGFEPGTPDHEPAMDSWNRTLAFFDEHLRV